MDEPQTLNMGVSDSVQTKDNFSNQAERQMKGTAGTLHVTVEDQKIPIVDAAWNLSKVTGLPVVVVVRAR